MVGLTVADVMARDVVTVSPTTPFKEIAKALAGHRISAVPVIEPSGKLVGVVSEADLLLKVRPQDERREPGAFSLARTRRRFRKQEATTAADVMTSEVTTIGQDVSLPHASKRLLAGKLRRLFVVDDNGALIGVLARRDVMRVFTRSDDDLADAVRHDVLRYALWAAPEDATVTVSGGEVTLEGELDRRSEVEWAGRLATMVPGVVTVHNHLTCRYEDIAAARL